MSTLKNKRIRKYIRNCSACKGEHSIDLEKVEVHLKLEGDIVTHVGVCSKTKKVIYIIQN